MNAIIPERAFAAKWHLKGALITLLLLLIMIGSGINTGVSTDFSWDQFWQIFIKMAHPDWGYASAVITPLLQTVQMSIVGTLLGTLIAIPFSLLAARNIVKNPVLRNLIRFVLGLVRSLPDLLLGGIIRGHRGYRSHGWCGCLDCVQFWDGFKAIL